MNRDVKTVAEWVVQADGVFVGVPTPVREAANRLTSSRRRSPRKEVATGRMKPTKEQLNQRTAEIRAACVKRCEGKCEMCGQPEHPSFPLEMHHLLSGGRRRWDQKVTNCLMVCPFCHDVCGGRILYAAGGLTKWAEKHGDAEARASIRRRIDKALLADPMWPRDEDETRRLGPDSIPREHKEIP